MHVRGRAIDKRGPHLARARGIPGTPRGACLLPSVMMQERISRAPRAAPPVPRTFSRGSAMSVSLLRRFGVSAKHLGVRARVCVCVRALMCVGVCVRACARARAMAVTAALRGYRGVPLPCL